MIDYLLQQGDSVYWPHLDAVEARHKDFADHNDLWYAVHRGATLPNWSGTWDSIPLMLDLIDHEDARFIFWFDADTLIVGDADPRDQMTGGELIAMARHPGPPEHYNCGVVFLRACAQTKALLQRMLDNGPSHYPWFEQNLMNEYLAEDEWAGKVKTLPHTWNSTVVLKHSPDCIVRAWHGYPGGPAARLKAMQAAISKFENTGTLA